MQCQFGTHCVCHHQHHIGKLVYLWRTWQKYRFSQASYAGTFVFFTMWFFPSLYLHFIYNLLSRSHGLYTMRPDSGFIWYCILRWDVFRRFYLVVWSMPYCGECRLHMQKTLQMSWKLPTSISNKFDLIIWIRINFIKLYNLCIFLS